MLEGIANPGNPGIEESYFSFSSKNIFNVLSCQHKQSENVPLLRISFPPMKTSGIAENLRVCLLKLKRKWESTLRFSYWPAVTTSGQPALPESVSSTQRRSRLATCNVVPKKSSSRKSTMHSVCSSKVRGWFMLDVCCWVLLFHKTSSFQLSRKSESLVNQQVLSILFKAF